MAKFEKHDKETRRRRGQGDKATRRRTDKGTRGQGDKRKTSFALFDHRWCRIHFIGSRQNLAVMLREQQAEAVMLAIPSASEEVVQEIQKVCTTIDVPCYRVTFSLVIGDETIVFEQSERGRKA